MSGTRFPIGVWGQVSGRTVIDRVRVEQSQPSGFLILTQEGGGTFDVWVETGADVAEFLEELSIVWESPV